MSEATLILPNMRGGCATVGTVVHTLFRVSNRSHRMMSQPAPTSSRGAGPSEHQAAVTMAAPSDMI